MNFQDIIDYKRPKESYYDILGCSQTSTIEQINREYKIRALQLHPDKNPDPGSLDKFRIIQRAKDVLTDESTRRSYDCWLNSRIHIPFERWQNTKGHSMHWASPRNTKLSIPSNVTTTNESSGQGSEPKSFNRTTKEKDLGPTNDWLGKFRNYEI